MERSSEIEQLVRDWFAAASRGDPSAVDRHVTADPAVRLVGSDPVSGSRVAKRLLLFCAARWRAPREK